jgi:hypothetical protein
MLNGFCVGIFPKTEDWEGGLSYMHGLMCG